MDASHATQERGARTTEPPAPDTARFLAEHDSVIRSVVAWGKWRFDAATREDVAQRSRLDVMQALPSYRGECRPDRWVKQVCMRRCIDEVRRQIRERRWVLPPASFDPERDESLPEPASGPEADPRILIGRIELARQITALVARLPDTCRRAIRQFYVDQLSYREIAQAEGLAINTVGSRLSKCLEKLRALARDDEGLKEYFDA